MVKYEKATVEREGDSPVTIHLAYRPGVVEKHPVILMLGALDPDNLPPWSRDLVDEGYLLAAFSVARPPDPDPARRPQWLVFDQRFAHAYARGGYDAPRDAQCVVDYLTARGDVNPGKIGWMGASSSGIPGLAVATQGPRLAAVVAFVSTGAYRQWLESWHTNKLWVGKTKELWPETEELLKYDPLLHVDRMFPTAVLLVSGGEDKIVDPKTARAFVQAARPYYESDPARLRLVIYDGVAHNLPADVVKMYIEHWFHLYLHPTLPPPPSAPQPESVKESTAKTEVTGADHKELTGSN